MEKIIINKVLNYYLRDVADRVGAENAIMVKDQNRGTRQRDTPERGTAGPSTYPPYFLS